MTADECIAWLDLQPHPEGGFYRPSYRAADAVTPAGLPGRFGAARPVSTAIYFLLRDRAVSRFHRLKSDELWHHYFGRPLCVHVIAPDGTYRCHRLGADLAAGMTPQLAVPHGAWFGAEVEGAVGYALVGNTVAPGFDFDDFELADRAELVAAYPQHAALIRRLTAGAGERSDKSGGP